MFGIGLKSESIEFRVIVRAIPNFLKPNAAMEDSVQWLAAKSGIFSTMSAWEVLRSKKQKVSCFKSVWFARKYALIG